MSWASTTIARGAPAAPSPRTTLLMVAAAVIVTVVVFGAVLGLALSVTAVRDALPTVIAFALCLHGAGNIAAAVLLLRRDGLTLRTLGFFRPSWRLVHLLWQIPATIVLVLVVQGIVFAVQGDALDDAGGSTEALLSNTGPVTVIAGFVGIAVLTPLWEEVLFRGMILGAVQVRWGTVMAVLVSAVAFAAIHAVPVLLPYLVTVGVCLALLRVFHRNLWAPLVLHITINSIASGSVLAVMF